MSRGDGALRKFDCPVAGFQQIINGKYKLRILWDLQHGPKRHGEIRKGLAGTIGPKDITPRVLSRELKALADMGLLMRKAYQVVPPKVEYTLTAEARTLIPGNRGHAQMGRRAPRPTLNSPQNGHCRRVIGRQANRPR